MTNKYKMLLTLAILGSVSSLAAAAEIVVIGNPSASPLTKDQVSDIFLGKSQSMTPIDQLQSAPMRADFYKEATGRDLAQVKSVWSRLVFSGKAQPPKELPDAAAIKKAIAADPKLVGYVEKSAVDSSVKVLLPLD